MRKRPDYGDATPEDLIKAIMRPRKKAVIGDQIPIRQPLPARSRTTTLI